MVDGWCCAVAFRLQGTSSHAAHRVVTVRMPAGTAKVGGGRQQPRHTLPCLGMATRMPLHLHTNAPNTNISRQPVCSGEQAVHAISGQADMRQVHAWLSRPQPRVCSIPAIHRHSSARQHSPSSATRTISSQIRIYAAHSDAIHEPHGHYFDYLACGWVAMKWMASSVVKIFSASSSGIVMQNSSSSPKHTSIVSRL